ncbi:MAG: restriction endonuclease subunit S [Geobacteraceae bacterium]|nr:restriction endonuclease subunit S [Geobacteraceae bacterium]
MKDSETTVMPDGWVNITVSDAVISISTNGKKIRQKEYAEQGRYAVVDQGQEKIGGYTDDEEILVDCQLPVIVFGDHTRVIKYVNQPFVAGADGIKVLQPHEFVDSRFLEHCLRHISESMVSKGYARHYQHLAKSNFPLPPLPEQLRIVAKLEELLSELDKGIESFKTAREQLKVYRQALLKHAFEGKLTAKWREENKDKLETAEVLLKRIQAERAERHRQQMKEWEKAVKGWEKGGKQGSKPGKPSKPKEMSPLTADELAELPDLPNGWGWVRVDEIADKVTDGEHITPKRTPSGYYLLSARNIQNGSLALSDVDYVPVDEYERIKQRCNPEEGDILISCSGSVGRVCRVANNIEFVMVRSVALVKMQTLKKNSKFFEYLFQSPLLQKQIERGKKATAQANLFLAPICALRVIICSSEEQQLIIQAIDTSFSEVDQLDQTITTALQQAETLRQSILKKAFSGQLVPQDPNDEPASKLLARIKAERAMVGATGRSPLPLPVNPAKQEITHD